MNVIKLLTTNGITINTLTTGSQVYLYFTDVADDKVELSDNISQCRAITSALFYGETQQSAIERCWKSLEAFIHNNPIKIHHVKSNAVVHMFGAHKLTPLTEDEIELYYLEENALDAIPEVVEAELLQGKIRENRTSYDAELFVDWLKKNSLEVVIEFLERATSTIYEKRCEAEAERTARIRIRYVDKAARRSYNTRLCCDTQSEKDYSELLELNCDLQTTNEEQQRRETWNMFVSEFHHISQSGFKADPLVRAKLYAPDRCDIEIPLNKLSMKLPEIAEDL